MAAPRSILRKLAFTVVVVVAFFAAVEGAARVYEWIVFGTVHVDGAPLGLYAPHRPGEGRALQPGANLEGSAGNIHVNSLGFRGAEISQQKPQNTVRLWCLGGSTTFDILATEDANTWPARLETHLRAQVTDHRVEVINAGIPGEHLNTNLRDLVRKGRQMRLDLVLIHQGPNDLRAIANEMWPLPFERPGLLSGLSAWRVVWDLLPPPPPVRAWEGRRMTADDMLELRRSMQRVVSEVQRQGAQPVILSHGFAVPVGGSDWDAWWGLGRDARRYGLTPRGLVESYDAMNQLFADIARRNGVPFIDLRTAVGGADEDWGDGIHFTDAGADKAGRFVAQELLSRGLVEPRR